MWYNFIEKLWKLHVSLFTLISIASTQVPYHNAMKIMSQSIVKYASNVMHFKVKETRVWILIEATEGT
jgi:hypothetical protein